MNRDGMDVGQSVDNFTWLFKTQEEDVLRNVRRRHNISEIVAKILINRGYSKQEEIDTLLHVKLSKILPNPFLFKRMKEVTALLLDSIERNERIYIFTDYDTDGTSAAATLITFFNSIKYSNFAVYIPNRATEGYGPNNTAILKMKEDGAKIIVYMDCGTNSVSQMAFANSLEMKCIVLDHHNVEVTDEVNNETIIINPNTHGETFPYKQICATTVVLIVVIALRAVMREKKYFQKINILEPDITPLTAFAALGTVCDVIPLNPLNRALIIVGIKTMRNRKILGLSVILDYLKLGDKLSVFHIGYMIGPRLNAGGRMDTANIALSLLIADTVENAKKAALTLEALNQERKVVEGDIMHEILAEIVQNDNDGKRAIIIVKNNLPAGIMGILANRVKEYSKKTAIIISIDTAQEKIKGSIRSIDGINIVSMLMHTKQNGLLYDAGGHPMAGGFNASLHNLPKIVEEFESFMNKAEDYDIYSHKMKTLEIDAILSVTAMDERLIKEIRILEPFGAGYPYPRFLLQNAKIIRAVVIQNIHVSVTIAPPFPRKQKNITCFLFRGAESKIGKFLMNNIGNIVDVVGVFKIEGNLGAKFSIAIEDASSIVRQKRANTKRYQETRYKKNRGERIVSR
ncbi:Single-stranded-DNA-specific exonuclease RecJ [Candidatus Fokinia solitaria]|uniref:Single-stranded-DNA-specific exonuclease RecJ n=1 Tax=Candidatus Fokinia solitaria TaxID=1802984 RepID=A0A2U8BSR6_9RICK|nr:single-stranded-DNA-specific exonuclease RecJ [Candidatus Fokinia solitaria]AWD33406.1 Single-stranded-DNA-specific exonuclease RecJ [Candidatus Fokinia solitaria]